MQNRHKRQHISPFFDGGIKLTIRIVDKKLFQTIINIMNLSKSNPISQIFYIKLKHAKRQIASRPEN